MEYEELASGAKLCALSLFSGGGIGDIALDWGEKIPVIAKCELLNERASLLRSNYPSAKVFEGDIWELKGKITSHVRNQLENARPWIIISSPPCQGMSSNGAGKISDAIKKGLRSENDERNRLILPSIDIIEDLMPDWFIFENVPNMQNTVIPNENNSPENILEVLRRRLSESYTIKSAVIDFADYGVAQNRKRLITIGCSLSEIRLMDDNPDLIFTKTPSYLHSALKVQSRLTLKDAISHLEPLDGRLKLSSLSEKLHSVPELNEEHYYWISHTKEGDTAFNNLTCPSCKTNHEVPISKSEDMLLVICNSCETPLPRPSKIDSGWICLKCNTMNHNGEEICLNGHSREKSSPTNFLRLISGFNSSYRRMRWDEPCKTITQNSGTFSSDGKGHPDQNRVLSLLEILLIQTIHSAPKTPVPWDGKYIFEFTTESGEKIVPNKSLDSIIRDVVGESIPPLGLQKIIQCLRQLEKKYCK